MLSSLSDCYGWRTGFIFMQHGRTERYQHQPLILYRKHLVQWTVLQISSNMLIDNNIIFSSLPAVCLCLSNLTAPQPLLFLSVRASSLSFYPSLALLTVPSTPSFCLSVCPALAVLTAPRSHAVAVFCSVMANGATPALSQPMDR